MCSREANFLEAFVEGKRGENEGREGTGILIVIKILITGRCKMYETM